MNRLLATMIIAGVAFEAGVTSAAEAQETAPPLLPRFEKVTSTSDSASVVAAANDALQGKSSISVPMVVVAIKRGKSETMVELKPVEDPRVVWTNLGGRVRILPDGKRIIVSRK